MMYLVRLIAKRHYCGELGLKYFCSMEKENQKYSFPFRVQDSETRSLADLAKDGSLWWVYAMHAEIERIFELSAIHYTHAWNPSAWVVRGKDLHYWACHCMTDKVSPYSKRGISMVRRADRDVRAIPCDKKWFGYQAVVCCLYVAAYLISGDTKWIDHQLSGERSLHTVDLPELEQVIGPKLKSNKFWTLMRDEVTRTKEGPRTADVLDKQVAKVLARAAKVASANKADDVPDFEVD